MRTVSILILLTFIFSVMSNKSFGDSFKKKLDELKRKGQELAGRLSGAAFLPGGAWGESNKNFEDFEYQMEDLLDEPGNDEDLEEMFDQRLQAEQFENAKK